MASILKITDIQHPANIVSAITVDSNNTIAITGNVGIGTTSSNASLHVAGTLPASPTGNGVFLGLFESAYGGIQLNGPTGGYIDFSTSGIALKGRIIYNHTENSMAFFTDAAERMRITGTGKFYVGATTSFYSTKAIIHWDSSTEQGITLKTTSATFNGSPLLFINNADGISGAVTQTQTTVAYATSSDYRLKENVLPMTGALAKIAALKPVTYTWKVNGSAGQGFIAHELQEIVPDCVTGAKDAVDENGNVLPQGVDTSFLVATLVAAIQELKNEIDILKGN